MTVFSFGCVTYRSRGHLVFVYSPDFLRFNVYVVIIIFALYILSIDITSSMRDHKLVLKKNRFP